MKKYTISVQNALCPFFSIGRQCVAAVMLLMFSLLGMQWGYAQSAGGYEQRAITASVPDVILMRGQSVTATIVVGNAANPIVNAIGFKFSLELSPAANATLSLDPNMTGSWIAETGRSLTEVNLGDARYEYFFTRSVPTNGSGAILQLSLMAKDDNVHARSLLRSASGLIQIDNLDLKMAAPGLQGPDLQVWPNPSHGKVQLRCNAFEVQAVAISTAQGQVISRLGDVQELDLSTYAPGTYIVQVTGLQGQVMHRRVVVD